MMPIKVLHVIPSVSLLRGGPSTAVIPMCHSLWSAGITCEIITTNDNGPGLLDVPICQWVEEDGVRRLYLPRFSPSWPEAVREYAYSSKLADWIRKSLHQYDIVHVHALFSHLPSRVMSECRRAGIPYVLRPLGILDEFSLRQSWFRKKLFLVFRDGGNIREAAAIHWTSIQEMQNSRLAQKLRRHRPLSGGNWVVPLGVEAPHLDKIKIPSSPPRILFLSRWAEKKRIPLLLEALSNLKTAAWHLELAGGDPGKHADILESIDRLGLSSKVSIPGFLSGEARERAFAMADIFVLPSASENFGMAVAEAMVRGVPVLVTPGVALAREVAEHRAGWVSGDTARELAQTLQNALLSATERESRGEAAADYAARHLTWSAAASALAERYRGLVAIQERIHRKP